MSKNKNVPSQKEAGKNSLNEAKTNEDFNKRKPQKEDPELQIKKIKK